MRKTTSMKKIRELLRLVHEGLSQRKAATCACINRESARSILLKAAENKLSWPLDESYTDEILNNILFPKNIPKEISLKKSPNCVEIQKELLKKGLTLKLLWTEYKEENPGSSGFRMGKAFLTRIGTFFKRLLMGKVLALHNEIILRNESF